MGRHAEVMHCRGVEIERDQARLVHGKIIEMMLAAGCPKAELYESGPWDGEVYDDYFAEKLEKWLGADWAGACMMGLGAHGGVQSAKWFVDQGYDEELEDYAVGFEARSVGRVSAAMKAKWSSTFGKVFAILGIAGAPKSLVVPQIH